MIMLITRHIKIDPFILLILATVIIASFFPCDGEIKKAMQLITHFAISLLFFMHGAKVSLKNVIQNLKYWQIHILIFSITFLIFPLIGLTLKLLTPYFISYEIYIGFVFLCALPATVQSAIAFTSIAKGNIVAAICSASLSSLLGVFITPLLIKLFFNLESDVQINFLNASADIFIKILLPFVIGLIMRSIIGGWIDKNKKLINKTDRLSILLVVYTAFSHAVINNIWSQITLNELINIIILSIFLLFFVLIIATYGSRFLGFKKIDEITIVFCGSKKSLVSGVPIASVLFPEATLGITLLPLLIFHQVQLMVCAYLASRYAKIT